jgi:hypothetical protein
LERVDTLLKRSGVMGEELSAVVEAYKEVLTTRMRDLDEVVNLIEAFPVVFRPEAPIMRKPDSTTLNAGTYVYMMQTSAHDK